MTAPLGSERASPGKIVLRCENVVKIYNEIAVLRARGRTKLPAEPTIQDAYLAIAALGGHIKYSGKPGWLTLARGYEKLELLVEGWVAAKLQPDRDQG